MEAFLIEIVIATVATTATMAIKATMATFLPDFLGLTFLFDETLYLSFLYLAFVFFEAKPASVILSLSSNSDSKRLLFFLGFLFSLFKALSFLPLFSLFKTLSFLPLFPVLIAAVLDSSRCILEVGLVLSGTTISS